MRSWSCVGVVLRWPRNDRVLLPLGPLRQARSHGTRLHLIVHAVREHYERCERPGHREQTAWRRLPSERNHEPETACWSVCRGGAYGCGFNGDGPRCAFLSVDGEAEQQGEKTRDSLEVRLPIHSPLVLLCFAHLLDGRLSGSRLVSVCRSGKSFRVGIAWGFLCENSSTYFRSCANLAPVGRDGWHSQCTQLAWLRAGVGRAGGLRSRRTT